MAIGRGQIGVEIRSMGKAPKLAVKIIKKKGKPVLAAGGKKNG